jgi:hypothetical protein
MFYLSKSMSVLMASASLAACLSSAVSAMEIVNDDENPGCCGIKKAVINHVAKKAEDCVLETAYTKAIEQLEPEIKRYCSETFGNGIESTLLGCTAQSFSRISINYLKEKVGTQLENMRECNSNPNRNSAQGLIISKTKVMFKDNAEVYIKDNTSTIKSWVNPIIEDYAQKAANCASAGVYTLATLGTFVIAGYESAGAVLIVGALDTIANKAGGLKYMVGFDKIVNSAKVQASHAVDSFDANVILKFYNTDVTEEDKKNAQEFDEKVRATKEAGKQLIHTAYNVGSSIYNYFTSNQ